MSAQKYLSVRVHVQSFLHHPLLKSSWEVADEGRHLHVVRFLHRGGKDAVLESARLMVGEIAWTLAIVV